MTSLTDKMEGLRKDVWVSGRVDYIFTHNHSFNICLEKCLALVKAEEAVVGDWEAEYDTKFADKDIGYSTDFGDYQSFEYSGVYDDVKAFIRDLLAAKDREREEAVKVERERIKKEIVSLTLLNDGSDNFVNLSEALWVCDSKEDRDRFTQALTPPTK